MKIPDPGIHLGLSSYIQAGGWPPATPWNPDFRVHYHHGVDMLIGLLAPPFGPNLVLVTEILSTYFWISFALVVATTMLNRGGWLWTLVLSPLLLTAGSWTLLGYLNRVPNIVQIPLPTEIQIPSASGIRSDGALLAGNGTSFGIPSLTGLQPTFGSPYLSCLMRWHSSCYRTYADSRHVRFWLMVYSGAARRIPRNSERRTSPSRHRALVRAGSSTIASV